MTEIAKSKPSGFRLPSKTLAMLEVRAPAELMLCLATAPGLSLAPKGNKQPVIVIPGFLAAQSSTLLLRSFLGFLGYKVFDWGLGRNLGPLDAWEEKLLPVVQSIHESTGQRVTIIGWSLGGVYARILAHHAE